MRYVRLVMVLSLLLGVWASVSAQEETDDTTTLLPIGGFYGDTFPGFIEAVLPHAGEDRVYILVVPASFAYDAQVLTAEDLLVNTRDAERRRRQLEDECNAMSPDLPCVVIAVPAYTTEIANTEAILDYLPDDLAGVYFLGGDQTIAMQIIANTVLEQGLAEAFARGVPMGGNSAGLAVLSYNMIAGYSADEFGPENGLDTGAVDIWNTDTQRGLVFGSKNVVLEQHFWERARLSRALNALTLPNTPNILIGVDSFTGGHLLDDTTFGDIFGLYTAAVFDAHTFGAADNAYFGDISSTLSMRNIVFHLLAEGDFIYDIPSRSMNIAPLITQGGVDYTGLAVDGAGAVIIGGNLFGPLNGEEAEILRRFIAASGGETSTIQIIATGYADTASAQATIDMYREALLAIAPNLQISESIVLDSPLQAENAPNGALIIGADQSLLNADNLMLLLDWHAQGTTLFFDGAASPLAGVSISAHPPTPYDSDDDWLVEEATQASFLTNSTTIINGLGLVKVNIEPRIMDDNRFGRWVSLAYHDPQVTTLGIADDTAIYLHDDERVVLGRNGVFALDLRQATLAEGTNGGKVFANGLLDVLTAGDALK